MSSSEVKKDALESLKGKWGKAVWLVLVFFAFSLIISLLQGRFASTSVPYILIDIAVFIISVPLSFGFIISFMKLKRGENITSLDFFQEGFSRFAKSWGIWFHTFIRILLPIICIILSIGLLIFLSIANILSNSSISLFIKIATVALYIASIVYVYSRVLLYSLSYLISYDNPELSSKACVLKSAAYMNGNRGNLFLLQLSFIGWSILSCITLGIGFIWLVPYIQVSTVCFYERVTKEVSKKVQGEVKISE